jgi:hypothetical protein
MRSSRSLPLVLLLPFIVLASGCKKTYACPEGEKDKSALQKWKDMGVPTDAPGITICEASEQDFNAAIPPPPAPNETARTLEAKIKELGWSESLSGDYKPHADDTGVSRRYEQCGKPSNPTGEWEVRCNGTLSVEVNVLPPSYKGNPYLLFMDHRPLAKNRYVLPGPPANH